jgi:alcohol dehydrogenase
MKAAIINDYGHADAFALTDIEVPKPQAHQVLVEVHASSLNPFDTKLREGYMKDGIPLQFPVVLGGDIAGIITEVGENVTAFAVGDKVYGQANVVAGNSGAFAEFAATKASQIAAIPTNVDFLQAASLPLVGVSALQALTIHLDLQPGQKLFIHGGAGGIGTIAIQIAKHVGVYVATTASGDGVQLAQSLGADEVIDYKAQDFTEVLHDYDAVFDTVGGEDFAASLKILKQGGKAVSMAGQVDPQLAEKQSVTAITQATHVTTEMLDRLRELVEQGIVTPHVASTYPLDQIVEAFTEREAGGVQGKVVLQIR